MGSNSSSLSPSQIKLAKDVFSGLYDKNNDGVITQDELKDVFEEMGENVSQVELDALFSEVDTNKSGSIEIKEFLAYVAKRYDSLNSMDKLKEAFKKNDKNGDGVISKDDFELIKGLVTDTHFKAALDELIFDEDGKLTYEDFCAMMATYSLADVEISSL